MQCPRCGFDQPDSDECISCGIIISKYLASISAAAAEPLAEDDLVALDELPPGDDDYYGHEAPPAAADEPRTMGGRSSPKTTAAGPVPSGLFRKHTKADEPIGAVAAAVRALAALMCLAIALVMVLNGQGLTSPWPYIIMVFYAGASLWGLTTFRGDVTLQAFATEMVVLVVVTLLRAGAPEMFVVEEEATATSPTVQPKLPNSPLGRFTQRSLDFVRAGLEAMDHAAPITDDAWAGLVSRIDFEQVRSQYGVMSTEDKARVYDIWKRISESGPMVKETFERYKETRPGHTAAFTAPDAERGAMKAELGEVLERVERLRARILVYPAGGLDSVKTGH